MLKITHFISEKMTLQSKVSGYFRCPSHHGLYVVGFVSLPFAMICIHLSTVDVTACLELLVTTMRLHSEFS